VNNQSGIVAIYGGMFDPVHLGHIKIAQQLLQQTEISELRLLPCYLHPDKGESHATSQHRYNMLKLIAKDTLRIDRHELDRAGTSYTVDTIRQIREELGNQTPLAFILGQDTYATINDWHNASELPTLVHLIVVARNVAKIDNNDSGWQTADGLEAMSHRSAGLVFFMSNALINISSSEIRALIAQNIQPRYLLPGTVWSYIKNNKLYGYQPT